MACLLSRLGCNFTHRSTSCNFKRHLVCSEATALRTVPRVGPVGLYRKSTITNRPNKLGLNCIHHFVHNKRNYHHRGLSNDEIQKKRVILFDQEVKRQNSLITDVEKIEVNYQGLPEDCTLMMNKNLSTPYHCAQHVSHMILERSVLAEVDGEVWDMFRPLTNSCTLRFLHFREPDPFYVNKAFWRSLSLMLGAVLESSFKDDVYVQLCSFPPPRVRSGSFVYDVDLPLDAWQPTKDELRIFSSQMVKLALASHPFHRLEVDARLALRIFDDNVYKKAQIPHIAAESATGNDIVLYRIGHFIDISRGPAMSHTRHLGKCSITGVFPFQTDQGPLYRVQGVALPRGFQINHYTNSIIEERARNLNDAPFPDVSGFQREVSKRSTQILSQD